MTRAQQRVGLTLVRALSAIEFAAELASEVPFAAAEVHEGLGGPRVEVRHPHLEVRGVRLLVAVVALDPEPHVAYAAPTYRKSIERTVRRAMQRRWAAPEVDVPWARRAP